MSSNVTYGKVNVAECPCCASPPVEFHSAEGRRRRNKVVTHYRVLSYVQLSFSVVAICSGATSTGLAAANPKFPFLSGVPLISGLLMLTAALFARGVGRSNMEDEIPGNVKRNVVVNYVLCVTGCSITMMGAVFAAVSLSHCLSADLNFHDGCRPYRDVKMGFIVADIICGVLLFITCVVGCVLFCLHARALGFQNRMQQLEDEVEVLRAQVSALSRSQDASGRIGGGMEAPPPYSEQHVGGGGFSYLDHTSVGGGGRTEYGVSPSELRVDVGGKSMSKY